jgi:oligopeptide/dipeptide ABC transporter ATP-binding protein
VTVDVSKPDPIVSAVGLSKTFDTKVATASGWQRTKVQAVSQVTLDIGRGETLALVGESGCGKTTLGRLLALFYPPTAGELILDGRSVVGLKRKQLRPLRRHVQMIFQDPMSSLNPRHTVETILTEPMKIFGGESAATHRAKAGELLAAVGLHSEDLRKYPHAFSGGQRQRITIARALALNPAFIVADEPVSALDVSVQSQILNLLKDLRDEFQLTYLFISHDMAVVHHLAERIAVMYLGRIVETASRDALFSRAVHPYTRALVSAVPTVTPRKGKIGRLLQGDPPSPIEPPSGCPFHPRCAHARAMCREATPVLEASPHGPEHQVACHLKDELA